MFTNKNIKTIVSIAILFFAFGHVSNAQIHPNGCNPSGANASSLGYQTTASGINSFSNGYHAFATGHTSSAIGYEVTASGNYSVALGRYLQVTPQQSFVIGAGISVNLPLINNVGGIMLGTGSQKPTMFISTAISNRTGSVGIGNVTAPQAKLHILSDNQEDAGIFLQTSNSDASSFIKLTDDQHCISVKEGKLSIVSSGNELNYFGTNAELSGNQFSIGINKNRKLTLDANESPAIFSNAYRSGGTFYRNTEGSSYAIEFNNDALRIRTAVNQIPRGTEITNWKDALFLTTDGRVGIGSTETFLMNKNDEEFILVSPQRTVMESSQININAQSHITLQGKVGVNATNNTSEYALAVNGGIITTEVFIQEVDVWHDGVFKDNYKLMPLADLQKFIKTNLHLPEVPTEAEVLKQGYDLAEMQGILLKKIEELTLYTIKQQELIEQLQQKVNELEAR